MSESILHRAYRLEMALRAQYLASERIIDFWQWVDMGLVRIAIQKSKMKAARKKYGINNFEVEKGQDL